MDEATSDHVGDEVRRDVKRDRSRAQRVRDRCWLAALVHLLLPGSGHAVLGRLGRGLAWLVAILVLVQVLLYTLTPYTWPLVFVVLWVAPIADIMRLGRRGLVPEELPRPGTAAANVLVVLAAALLLQLGMRVLVSESFRLPSTSMAPTLRIGDHILANKLAYRLGAPARGDVAIFRLPCEPDTIFVKRVVALGGDTVELRCGVLYINGAPVPQELVEDGDTCTYWEHAEDIGHWQQESCSRYAETLDHSRFEIFYDAQRPARDEARRQGEADPRGLLDSILGIRDFPGLQHGLPELPACGHDLGSDAPAALGRFEPSVPEHNRYPGVCAPVLRYVVPAGHVFVLGDHRDSSSDSRNWGPVPVDHLEGKVAVIWWSSAGPAGDIDWRRIGTRVR